MTETVDLLEQYEPVIGLEVHVQLATLSKAFSPSAVRFGAPPNSLTDPTVLGMPGTLPQFNRAALELALRLGVATNSRIRTRTRFARKHYFYPDQPKGYQISQYDEPLCEDGALEILVDGDVRRVRLQRIHLEEDAGKNTHAGPISHIDLNRAGVPLVEVVSAPVMRDAEEAAEFMRSLHRLVRWLDISEADMEKGQLRCDANVSVRRRGEDRLGTRTELKNINSFRFVENAINHEIARQLRLIDRGERVVQETRLWDADAGTSQPMRSKETADDYRYFPDPDLPPLVVDGALMVGTLTALPELPTVRFTRYVKNFGLAGDDARILVSERAFADYFDAAVLAHPAASKPESPTLNPPARAIANWILGELFGALNAAGLGVDQSPVPPDGIAQLVALVEAGTISGKLGKQVFEEAFRSGESPGEVVARLGLTQISDAGAIWEVVNRIVAANPRQAEEFARGKDSLFGFFVGQVMKATDGRANPAIASDLLHKRLGR